MHAVRTYFCAGLLLGVVCLIIADMVCSFYSAVLSVYFISVNFGCLLFWNYGILILCPLVVVVFSYLCVSHFVLSRAKNHLSLFDKLKQQDLCTTTSCSCHLTLLPHMLWL